MQDMDYVWVLKALRDIPFPVGKRLLVEYLRGDFHHPSVQKNQLDLLESFGALPYEAKEIELMISGLLKKGYLCYQTSQANRFWKLLGLTASGVKELKNPTNVLGQTFKTYEATTITDEDKRAFEQFSFFVNKYNDEQKKAIISPKDKILCIAGAGSGKTTVLTKRIEFLMTFRSVGPKKILAVTFTRKARKEMMARIKNPLVQVETFNSFCERMLQLHNREIYGRPVFIINYTQRIRAMRYALSKEKIEMGHAVDGYFSSGQRRGKTNEELARIFMNDCFTVLDYYKSKRRSLSDVETSHLSYIDKKNVTMVMNTCGHIDQYMKQNGLRDYSDQLSDVVDFFEAHKDKIPQYDHILVDEYQDVNDIQIQLLDLLNGNNLFCVGDPRQSIYGWRGSKIEYILRFTEKYPDAEVITLTKNYRSLPPIVDLSNKAIVSMNLPDLQSACGEELKPETRLLHFETDEAEYEFIIQSIMGSLVSKDEIFVLSRTNRQLVELSDRLKLRGISHVVRSDEVKRTTKDVEGAVTLATVHAIKGLEAHTVFVMGCTSFNYPCKASDHPILELIKMDEYDKEQEELRLLYVALSRAKAHLFVTYSGLYHTKFIGEDMKVMLGVNEPANVKSDLARSVPLDKTAGLNKARKTSGLVLRLKDWRREISQRQNIAPYMVMHDKTLLELCERLPLTLDDLSSVYGFGPNKIRKYGQEVLDVLHGMA